MKNVLMLALVLGMLLLAGCTAVDSLTGSGSSSSGTSGGYAKGGVAMAPSPVREALAPQSAAFDANSANSGQQFIKTANAEVEVPAGSVQDRYSQFKASILSQGGQIESADYSETDTTKEYNVQAKLSPDKFEGLAAMLRGIGTVKVMNTNVNDVSNQYTDIQTRISNLQTERDQLLKLYNQSGNLSDLLAVQQQLTEVQTQIEEYQNEKLNLDRQIGMSSVSVRIYETAPPVAQNVLDPLKDVGNVFFGALAGGILLLAGLLGLAIPAVIALGILYLLYKRLWPWWPKKASKK